MGNDLVKILRVKASTDATKLAGSIYAACMEDKKVVLRVIGAGSLNQATKAVIISNKYFCQKGLTPCVKPSFHNVSDNVTAIELVVFLQNFYESTDIAVKEANRLKE